MGVLVVISPEQDRDAFVAALDATGLAYSPFAGLPRHFHLDGVTPEAVPALPGVVSVEPDDAPLRPLTTQALSIAADFSGANWGLARIIRRKAPWWKQRLDASFPYSSYYQYFRDGTGVDIYMLDSGIRTTHSEVTGRATNVYEYYSSGGAGDDQGHGTQTSALAAGATIGVARGALLFSFKCIDSSNAATALSVTTAISQALAHYNGRAATNRPAVANFSLELTSSIDAAIADMIDAGIVVCVAAGNAMSDLAVITQNPAEAADVICCGGIGPADIPFYANGFGTNWGTRVDISAAAQAVYTATNTGDAGYTIANGTSLAAPLATGVAACLLQGEGRLTGRAQVQQVRQHIIDTATTGELTNAFGIILPDRILYLDPRADFTPLVLS